MKKFRTLRMPLFDSSNANFKINLEGQFTTGSEQTGYHDRVFITERQTGILSPTIYLTFSYKSNDGQDTTLYTSYPQLFKIRDTFKKVLDGGLLDNSAFVEIDGKLTVRPDKTEPFVISNIGKDNNWMSLSYQTMSIDNNEVSETVPAVSIETSKTNRYCSLLTVDEFLTVYTILNDINLPSLQLQMSLAYLDIPVNGGQMGYPQYQPPMMQPQGGYYPQQRQNWQYGNNGGQRYNNFSAEENAGVYNRNNSAPRQSYRTNQTPPPPTTQRNAVVENQPAQQPKMEPRTGSSSIMSMKAIEDTPIDTVSYDDTDALNSIFNDEE